MATKLEKMESNLDKRLGTGFLRNFENDLENLYTDVRTGLLSKELLTIKQPEKGKFLNGHESVDKNFMVYEYTIKSGGKPDDVRKQAVKQGLATETKGIEITNGKAEPYSNDKRFNEGDKVYVRIPKEKLIVGEFLNEHESRDKNFMVYEYGIMIGGTPASVRKKAVEKGIAKEETGIQITDGNAKEYPENQEFRAGDKVYVRVPKEVKQEIDSGATVEAPTESQPAPEGGKDQKEQTETKTILKEKPIDLKYSEKNKEKKALANFPKNERSVEGRITRCLRFSSITDAVEDRYGIPRGLLMAMMAQEGRGDPTVINQRTNYKPVGKNKGNYVKEGIKYRKVEMGKGDYIIDEDRSCDGGAGLIHIQAANAIEYGMKTLPTYAGRSMIDYKHGEELEKAKKETGDDLAKLSELDDRFNPVLSVDLSARFLMNEKGGKKAKTGDGWINVACNYAGRHLSDYGYSVLVYWSTINKIRGNDMPTFTKELEKVKSGKGAAKVNDKRENVTDCITRTRTAIDNMNPTIDGESVSLDEYYKQLELHRDNYGLNDYKEYDKGHSYVK